MNTRAPKKPDIVHPGVDDIWAVHRPSYSAYCRYCEETVRRNKIITALYLSLKAFGYSTLTREETERAYDLALAGPVAESGDIIAMLIRSQLEEAGAVS